LSDRYALCRIPTGDYHSCEPLAFIITAVDLDSFTILSVTYACSGPGAMAFIEANSITALIYATFGFILVLATVTFYSLRKKKGLPIVCFSVAVLVVHPAWTISAMIGDCGMSKVSMAKYATGALGAGFLLQSFLWFVGRRNQRDS
jgi:hypothetical protein